MEPTPIRWASRWTPLPPGCSPRWAPLCGGAGARRAIAPSDRTAQEPGEAGVRLRCFLDLRQEPGSWPCGRPRPR
ncbi:DUF6207 family protein [Streptomyces sp. SP18BB07]|nr:DUF6207 family protein [Streptomyces sp. SP18BB07]